MNDELWYPKNVDLNYENKNDFSSGQWEKLVIRFFDTAGLVP